MNIKVEKVQYIVEVFVVFVELFGNLYEESYIYVQDVCVVVYGYGGKMQEYCYQYV